MIPSTFSQHEICKVNLSFRDPQLTEIFRHLDLNSRNFQTMAGEPALGMYLCPTHDFWLLGIELGQKFDQGLWDEIDILIQPCEPKDQPVSGSGCSSQCSNGCKQGCGVDCQIAQYSLTEFHHHFVAPWLADAIVNKKFSCFTQPVVSAEPEPQMFGHEFLLRYESQSKTVSARELFKLAKQWGLHEELHWAAIENCLTQCFDQNNQGKVFININPSNCHRAEYAWSDVIEIVADSGCNIEDIVFDLCMTSPGDEAFLAGFAREFRKQGFEISLDNWGESYPSYKLLDLVRPDYLKIDSRLIGQKERYQEILIDNIVTLSSNLGIQTIATGIESQEDFRLAKDRGFRYLQGFYVGKPASSSGPKMSNALTQVCDVFQNPTSMFKVGQ